MVKRGIDEFNIEDGESEQIDHLMFMVHGIGAACDLKFRPVEEVGMFIIIEHSKGESFLLFLICNIFFLQSKNFVALHFS